MAGFRSRNKSARPFYFLDSNCEHSSEPPRRTGTFGCMLPLPPFRANHPSKRRIAINPPWVRWDVVWQFSSPGQRLELFLVFELQATHIFASLFIGTPFTV